MPAFDEQRYLAALDRVRRYDRESSMATVDAYTDDLSRDLSDLINTIVNKYTDSFSPIVAPVIAVIIQFPDPGIGIIRFERFLDVSGKDALPSEVSTHLAWMLGVTFATSGALSVRLAADTGCIPLLDSFDPWIPCHDHRLIVERYANIARAASHSGETIAALHRLHTAELVRILARNADPGIPVEVISAELSTLAEAVLSIALTVAVAEITSGLTEPQDSLPFFVLGLGKLGGRELNVSSDIDLIYLVNRGEGWHSFEEQRFFTQLAEHLTQILTEATDRGYLYRVDTRLRADGSSGPLVRTTGDYLRYLELRGQAWERQMLLKARTVAGNRTMGEEFLESLTPFLFPGTLTRSPNQEIVALKNQIEARLVAEGSKKTHLKLMPGGIRDIEFTAQCLLLLTGGPHPEVRTTGTLAALDNLHGVGALSDDEHHTLTENYRLYRRIENALQWRELLPAFTLPENPLERSAAAIWLGHPGIFDELENRRLAIRSIYNDIFGMDREATFEECALRASMGVLDDQVRRFLENLGFTDSTRAAQDLHRLLGGAFDTTTESSLPEIAERFIPRLLEELQELSDPGGTLEQVVRISDAYSASITLFGIMLENQGFFDLILTIAHGSVFLTDILVQDPSLLDWLVEAGQLHAAPLPRTLATDLDRITKGMDDDRAYTSACLTFRLREELRIGVRDLTGLADATQTDRDLSALASVLLNAITKRTITGIPPRDRVSFAVIAAGKLGSERLEFGSDLDLVFVYRPSPAGSSLDAPETAIRLAQRILAILGGDGVHKLYDVDTRLRPEGGNSPLAVAYTEYVRYFERRGSVWERLALVRARAIAGDAVLGAETEEAIRHFVFGQPLTGSDIAEIMRIRAAMVEQSQKRSVGQIDIKAGKGGIADIDFIAQTAAVKFGSTCPALQVRDTPELLTALSMQGLLPRDESAALTESYEFLAKAQKALRIGSGRAVTLIPRAGAELVRVSRLLGFKNVRRFLNRLEEVLSMTADRYRELLSRWSEEEGVS